MKSGTLNNDGKHSMIYRGIEDIFGNIWQFMDGINVNNHQTYINYNPKTYQVDTFNGDYQALGYVNAKEDGYVKSLGYDSKHPLFSFAVSLGGSENSPISDYYLQATGKRIALGRKME